MDHRHAAALAQHVSSTGSATVGPRPLAPPSPCRSPSGGVADAGDGLRTRQAFLSCPNVLTGRDDLGDDPPARPLRNDTRLGRVSATRTRADWRGGTLGRT